MNTLSKIRCLIVPALMALLISANGCSSKISPGADLEHATLVTFAQSKEETKDETAFHYLGSDKAYHYFQTENGFYRLSAKFKMPFFQRQIDSAVARDYPPGLSSTWAQIRDDTIMGASGDVPGVTYK